MHHLLAKPMAWFDDCSYEEINLAGDMAERIQDATITEAWVNRVSELVEHGKDGVVVELFKRLQKSLVVHPQAASIVFDLLGRSRTCQHQLLFTGLQALTPPELLGEMQNSILQGIF